MRIVIDLQGAQTESRFRGIGRYSMALALAIARNAPQHEVWLVLNAGLASSIGPIRRAFEGIVARERILSFDIPAPVAASDPSHAWRARAAEKIRECFIEQLRPDIVLVSSLFEGFVDDGVVSVGEFASGGRTAVVSYDLIPLLNPSAYLPTRIQQEYYERKIRSLRQAGLLLAISDYSRREAVEALELDPERVVSISSAADNRFTPGAPSAQESTALLSRFGIQRKMVMVAPGGLDARKNVDGLIAAYGLLASDLRGQHQLVVVSKLTDRQRDQLQDAAVRAGLAPEELVLTGYVTDDDLAGLYRAATLFVLPSTHEGFGLPALEAMACGTAVIGSNATSIPEVIGREDALFDPFSPQDIADKMAHVLRSDDFRDQLRRHALAQARRFSWDETATRALRALESHHASAAPVQPGAGSAKARRLAFVAPLPPERTGIAQYSAELLPALMRHFDIELITDQAAVALPPVLAALPRRPVAWFQANAHTYDRILYQFGNSPFHSHMFDLLQQHPGVVVLHDFFLSSVLAHGEDTGSMPGAWTQALYHSHGYLAVQERYAKDGGERAKETYPCNLDVIEAARGVIVHSEHARRLACQWYGAQAADRWRVIPLLRTAAHKGDRTASREALGIPEGAFLVCSFGFVDATKLSHRVVEAFLSSRLASDPDCLLVLAGTQHGGEYGAELARRIARGALQDRVHVTGWLDDREYGQYLQAADLAIQLRTLSRGETSAAVLDCMNHGLPVIVNANGSMADLPEHAVWKLPDVFSDHELVHALESLWQNAQKRDELGRAARDLIRRDHDPASCAAQYAQAIEAAYETAATDQHALVQALADAPETPAADGALRELAQAMANSTIFPLPRRQLLVDVSAIALSDLHTGIERVVRAQLSELLRNPPAGCRIEPVRLSDDGGAWRYFYARAYTGRLLGYETGALQDAPVDLAGGDIFYSPDFFPGGVVEAARAGLYENWRARGVETSFLVHDLLPISHPAFFPTGSEAVHARWLACVSQNADRLICISHAVADEVRRWLDQPGHGGNCAPIIDVVHHGWDIGATAPTSGLPADATQILERLATSPSFLMVGTIEPRKGHLQALAAFEALWRDGRDVNLVIVGREGWTHLPQDQRRTIPQIVRRLGQHPELGKRLFWLRGISDEYLQQVYAAGACLLAPSEGEGFGLPLIEAAGHGLPAIARDLPVFREVAPAGVQYFSGLSADDLARAVAGWLDSHPRDKPAAPAAGQQRTWADNVRQLARVLLRQEGSPVQAC